jgi:hypothetical protein
MWLVHAMLFISQFATGAVNRQCNKGNSLCQHNMTYYAMVVADFKKNALPLQFLPLSYPGIFVWPWRNMSSIHVTGGIIKMHEEQQLLWPHGLA